MKLTDVSIPTAVLTYRQLVALAQGTGPYYSGFRPILEWIRVTPGLAEACNGVVWVRTEPRLLNGDQEDGPAFGEFYLHPSILGHLPGGSTARYSIALAEPGTATGPVAWVVHADGEVMATLSGERLLRRQLDGGMKWPNMPAAIPGGYGADCAARPGPGGDRAASSSGRGVRRGIHQPGAPRQRQEDRPRGGLSLSCAVVDRTPR